MHRVALSVEYNGRNYFGWQSQLDPATLGVQDVVESALSRVANHTVNVVCAGRTDSGVHATGQIIHFNTSANRTPYQWVRGANSNLPRDVRIRWACEVSDEFHARFSALSRRYKYVVDNRAVAPAMYQGLHSWCASPLDEALMHAEAQALLGEHDFSSFRAAGCQAKTATREITHISVVREGYLVSIHIEANAFLQHMVRNIAGVLMAVGSGKQAAGWTSRVLAAKDRTRGGVTASPDGLALVGVSYPALFNLPPLLA